MGQGFDGVLLGIDVGGTFTDALVVAGGGMHAAKVLTSTPQSSGVVEAAQAALGAAGLCTEDVSRFVHGMTVATNALLERKGARVVVIGTAGFRDLLEIGRQQRSQLYTFHPARTPPLVPRERCLTVRERVGPGGVEESLAPEAAIEVCRAAVDGGAEAVAVCLLWSFLAPEHERLLRRVLEEIAPDLPVTCSWDLSPLFREYERLSTTVVDAYVTPVTRGYLETLARTCAEVGLMEPEIMQSSGGTTTLEEAAAHGGRLLLSGPAGGAVAARGLGAGLGLARVISFDMGGTSTDCAALTVGDLEEPLETSTERTIAGLPVRLPAVDIHTVSAGGGSIASVDEGGALKVGPTSAGAAPGPACYGRGGEDATVTDAHVVLGRIPHDAALAGTLRLDASAARTAVAAVGGRVGLDAERTAEGIVRVATFNMAAALRAVTLERGLDPRGYTLVSFGGAGGLHACELAEEVGVSTVAVPVHAGVFSALGLVLSPPRADAARTLLREAASIGVDEWESAWTGLESTVGAALGPGGGSGGADTATAAAPEPGLRREVEARYVGQSYELNVALGRGDGPREAAAAFAAAHERRFGFADPDGVVEMVTLRSVGSLSPGPVPGPPPAPTLERRSDAPVYVDGGRRVCSVYGIAPSDPPARPGADAAARVDGPALITSAHMTVWVAPGWAARPASGALLITRGQEAGTGRAAGCGEEADPA